MSCVKQSELKFDLDAMREMKQKLTETAQEISEIKKNTFDSLEKLKEKWNTPAGKKFFSDMDTGWATDVDKYITIIHAVEELLGEAVNQYADVENEIGKLKFYV